MNYVSAAYGILLLIIICDWFIRGKHHYRGQDLRHEEVAQFRGGSLEVKRHFEVDNTSAEASGHVGSEYIEKI